MGQVLLNLLRNALEGCPEHGRIEVALSHEDGALVLRLDNDSPPLSAETLRHAFDAFFSSKPKGTGLGLAIARRIVEEHHGEIGMANLPTGQVRVSIRLPTVLT